jgi:hypothetical protein
MTLPMRRLAAQEVDSVLLGALPRCPYRGGRRGVRVQLASGLRRKLA